MNLTKFTEHFNNMSYWTRTIILQQPDAKVWKMPIRIMVIIVFNNFRPRSASVTWWSSSRLWSGFGRWTTSTLTSLSSPHWTQLQSGDLVNISSCIHFIIWRQRGKNHHRLACRVLFVQRSWTSTLWSSPSCSEWQKTITDGLAEYCSLIDSSSSFRAYR